MGSRAISYQVPEYRERSTTGTVVSGSRCSMPPQAAAARKILPIPSDWRVFMKGLGVLFSQAMTQEIRRQPAHAGPSRAAKCLLRPGPIAFSEASKDGSADVLHRNRA